MSGFMIERAASAPIACCKECATFYASRNPSAIIWPEEHDELGCELRYEECCSERRPFHIGAKVRHDEYGDAVFEVVDYWRGGVRLMEPKHCTTHVADLRHVQAA